MATRTTATRQRTKKLFVDSRNMVVHQNNNPSKYTYVLPRPIPNVTRVRLITYRVPYSPTFMVIRRTAWMIKNSIAVGNYDSIQQQAEVFARHYAGVNSETDGKVLTLSRPSGGGVGLNVVEVFTSWQYDTASTTYVAAYAIFVCTGTISTTDRTGWQLNDLTAGASPASWPFDTVSGAATWKDSSDTAAEVTVIPKTPDLYLRLNVGGQLSRLNSARQVYPPWQAFNIYRAGIVVNYKGTRYTCNQAHMSLVFATDGSFWTGNISNSANLPADVGSADNSFYVIEPTAANETVLQARFGRDDVTYDLPPTDVGTIGIEWLIDQRRRFRFPHTTSLEYTGTALSTADPTYVKEYSHHTLALELTYEEQVQVYTPGNTAKFLAGQGY